MNRRNEKAITLIALVVTIVVLLILAGISISMLTGENGIIKQAQDAKENSSQAKVEEAVKLAITSLIAENKGDKSVITPGMIAEQVNKDENRTDVTAEGTTFPTNIIFTEENRKVEVDENLNLGSGSDSEETATEVFDDPSLEAEAEKNVDLFEYEIIDTAEVGATEIDSLPTKTARITGIKPKYCNGIDGGYYDSETGETIETNYEIIFEGEKITDTLVVPYQVEIDGEMYKITEADVTAVCDGMSGFGRAYPSVKTIIYPNCIEKIISSREHLGSPILENVVLPENLISIEDCTFQGCEKLTNIIIPESVTNIGVKAFSECTGLTSVTILEGVKSIGDYAFDGCESLTSVTISGDATSIGERAFYRCESLTSVTISGDATSIGYMAFCRCTSLTNVTISGDATSIGGEAFSECTSLTSVTISRDETSIGYRAFFGCTSLTNVTISGDATSIGSDAFEECTSLTSVTILEGVTSIGDSAFRRCEALTSVTILEGLTSIGDNAFNGCTGLTGVTIPGSVTNIGNNAFYGCTGLTTVNYTGSEEQWKQITIGKSNSDLTSSTINYNYKGE